MYKADMKLTGAHPIAEAIQKVGKSTTLSGYRGGRAGRWQKMTKDAEQFTPHGKIIRIKRWKHKSVTW